MHDQHSFNTNIAREVGINSAVIFNHIVFWWKTNKANRRNFKDGKYWTYNSVRAFQELFDYLTYDQIRHSIEKLVKYGFVETGNYNKDKRDRSKWYTPSVYGLSYLESKNPNSTFGKNPNSTFGKNPEPLPYINTDINNTDSQVTSSHTIDIDKETDVDIDNDNDEGNYKEEVLCYWEQFEDAVKKKIGYDDLLISHSNDTELINSIVHVLVDFYITQNNVIKINNEMKPKEVIKAVYHKLTYWHIEHVINKFKEQSNKIIFVKSYLRTILYNAVIEKEPILINQVNSSYAMGGD